jgi:hypothetical protein
MSTIGVSGVSGANGVNVNEGDLSFLAGRTCCLDGIHDFYFCLGGFDTRGKISVWSAISAQNEKYDEMEQRESVEL